MTSWFSRSKPSNHPLAYRFEGEFSPKRQKGRRPIPARRSRAARATQPLVLPRLSAISAPCTSAGRVQKRRGRMRRGDGLLRETESGLVIDGVLPPLAIPTTLQGSLLARLDRLSTTREVAQISAAIGREFDYELLAAVAGLP